MGIPDVPRGSARPGGGVPDDLDPSRGRAGEFAANPGGALVEQAVRRDLGAPGELPFTGMFLWVVALAALPAVAGGTAGRWAIAR